MENLAKNISNLKERISQACSRVGRNPNDINILPVTKTKPIEVIKEAYQLGFKTFGENKVQELCSKAKTSADLAIKWSMIGHLQTNKVKNVIEWATEIQSLDRVKLAIELDRRLLALGKSIDILIQVNTSNEDQKYGISIEDAKNLAKNMRSFSTLNIKGLMTLAIFSKNQIEVRNCFKKLKETQKIFQQDASDISDWKTLSMGMSSDFEIAIEEGSTEIRVGQLIFGRRAVPNSHYWPT